MADNFGISGGTAGTVATDDVGGVHYQYVKVADGAYGGTAVAAVDANGLDVDVTRVGGTPLVQGPVATGAAAAGNPLYMGGYAGTSFPTAVDAADVVPSFMDGYGRSIIFPFAPPAQTGRGTATSAGTVAVEIIAAAGANLKWYVTELLVTNEGTVGNFVKVQDDAGTPYVYAMAYCAASGGGYSFSTRVPQPGQANGKVQALCSNAGSVHFTAYAFKAP